MKWFLRLFLLFTFSLLSEYGIHAYSPEREHDNAIEDVTGNNHIDVHQNIPLHFSAPGIVKNEFRKTRGTNEEEDEDEKNSFIKKTRSTSPNNLHSEHKSFALLVSTQSTAGLSNSSLTTSFPTSGFFYLNNKRRYTLFQVFRI